MPDKDILAAIGENSENVLHKAEENIELCQRFMALVSLCALETNQRGANMSGLQIGNVVMSGNRMIAKVAFSKLIVSRSQEMAPGASSLVQFLRREAEGLWLFIRKNPCLVKYLQQIIERMDAYSRDKGKPFHEISFSNGFMDKTDNIVLEIEQGA